MTSPLRTLLPSLKLMPALLMALPLNFLLASKPSLAASTTATTLTATANGSPVTTTTTGTAVTLTAAITSSGAPVTHGLVNFCDATATYCTDIHRLGTATLTSNGTAAYKFIPGVGAHRYKAVFQATTQYQASSSTGISLTVTGLLDSVTTLVASGKQGDYTLTTTVAGIATQPPTGTVSFDDFNGNPFGPYPLIANPPGVVFSLDGSATVPVGFGNAVADLNSDGTLDAIFGYRYTYSDGGTCASPKSANESTDRVTIYFNSGDATFTNNSEYDLVVPCNPTSIAVGDFNGDGLPDVIVSSPTGAGSLFLQTYPASFAPSSASTPGGNIVVQDWNGDGYLDIVGFQNGVSVALGNGDGTFKAAIQVGSGSNAHAGAAGDFNGDGIPDLATIIDNPSGSTIPQSIQILLGVGDGTFIVSKVIPPLTAAPTSIFVADVNNDGKADLIVLDSALKVSILTGDGAGNFSLASSFTVAPQSNAYTYTIAIGDFNNDGIADIAAVPTALTLSTPPPARLFLGRGTGVFSAQTVTYAGLQSNLQFPATAFQQVFSAGDLNGDGIPDIISASGSFLIGSQSATAVASSISPQPPASGPHGIVALYRGDSQNLSSQSLAVVLDSAQGTASVAVNAAVNPAVAGQPLVLTATVVGGDVIPTGAVNFFNGAALLGTANLTPVNPVQNTNSAASLSITAPAAGSYSITASYLGDASYTAASSPAFSLTTVKALTPAITVKLSANPAVAGQPLTLTATATGAEAVPTGTVNFYDGPTSLGTANLINGMATLTVGAPAAGSHSITAAYLGDAYYIAVISPPYSLTTLNTSVVTLALTSGGKAVTTISSFQPVTLTATAGPAGSPLTSGTIDFCSATQPSCYGAALLGTAQVTASGTASITIRPAQGSHSYKALLLATANYATTASAVQNLTVTQPTAPQLPTQTSITSTGTTGAYTLTATVTGNGSESLAGNLNFMDLTHGNSILATQPLTAPVTSQGFMFVPAQTSPQVATPLATGDFNQDGILDMVVSLPGGIGLQLGNGDLTFKSAIALPGAAPVAVGDFNSDGKLDLALIASGGVQIYLGDGTGKLTALPLGPALPSGQYIMSAVDFNRDGHLDLVTQDTEFTHVLLGVGDGTFTAGATVDVTVGGDSNPEVTSMVTGDFNADGIPDIAVAWLEGGFTDTAQYPITFLFGDGTGNFTSYVAYPNLDVGSSNPPSSLYGANPGPMYIAALDLNQDGKQDLIGAWSYVACCPEQLNSGTINLINNGDGTMTPSGLTGGPQDSAQGTAIGITVLDLNGNGADTIAIDHGQGVLDPGTGEPGEPPIIVYNNAPSFSLPTNFNGGFVPGDFDNDGIEEIAVGTNSSMSIVGFQVTATATASNIAVKPAGSGTHQVEASYTGDPVHTSSVSTPVSLNSGIATPTLQLSAVSSAPYGTAVVITATMTSSGPTPTGIVTFLNGTSTLGTGTLAKGVATLSVSTLALGSNSITATYPGDANNSATTASAIAITVTKDAPTLTLTASPTSAVLGAAVTFTAKFSGTKTVPTGSITFQSQSGSLGSKTLNGSGVATLAASSLPAGSNSVTASYAGDSDNSAATSSPITVPVAPAVAVTSALSTIYSGLTDTITVTLSTGSNTTAPAGTITLTSASFTSAATPLSAGSTTISIPANTLPAGSNTITAAYSGDTNYPASTGQVTVTVTTAPPPGFSISAPAVTLTPGGSSGSTVAVTLTPVTGFTGNVSLSAQVTSSPTAATDPPTLSFGSTSTVAITGSSAATATLTITTSPVVTSRLEPKPIPRPIPRPRGLFAAGGALLACVLLWGAPGRRLHRLLRPSHRRWLILVLVLALASIGLSGCGGGSKKIVDPGTTPGSYTITVTGTSGVVTETGTVTLTVQ